MGGALQTEVKRGESLTQIRNRSESSNETSKATRRRQRPPRDRDLGGINDRSRFGAKGLLCVRPEWNPARHVKQRQSTRMLLPCAHYIIWMSKKVAVNRDGSICVGGFFQFSTSSNPSPMGWISSVELLSYGNYTLVSIRMEVSGTTYRVCRAQAHYHIVSRLRGVAEVLSCVGERERRSLPHRRHEGKNNHQKGIR